MKAKVLCVVCLLLVAVASVSAQEITRGSMLVTATDPTGAVIPNAAVTLTSALGEFKQNADSRGAALFLNLIPSPYDIKVEVAGFKTYTTKGIVVRLNERAIITVKLEVGQVTETVEVTGVVVGPDFSTTSTGANITSSMFGHMPLPRGVIGPAYLAPGVTDSVGAGFSNPSIAGASGLENLYLIDGVNNTNTGFGGFGTYSLIFGSVGTGVTTAFIQEVQVKTGGMEAQYGQFLGGVVSMVTKSGGNDFHGSVFAYYAPRKLSAAYKQANRSRTSDFLTETHGVQSVDWGAEGGGRIIKDRLFFFGAINPANTHTSRQSPPGPSFLGPGSTQPIGNLGEHDQIRRTINYAGKLTYRVAANHQVEASIFGDPSIIRFGPNRSLVVADDISFSRLDFSGLNWQVRYNGSITPKWVVTASFGQNHNRFEEQQLKDEYLISDRALFNRATGLLDDSLPVTINRGGAGPFQNTFGGADRQVNADSGHTFSLGRLGQHSVNIGFQYENSSYNGTNRNTGPDWPIPSGDPKIASQFVGANTFGAQLRFFSCSRQTGSPTCNGVVPASQLINGEGFYFRQRRGNFKGPVFTTSNDYWAAYIQDNWQLNKYVTVKAGLRWEEENMIGNPTGFPNDCPVGFSDPATGDIALVSRKECNYAFTGSWAPRIGVVVDPWGNRKGKAYASFGRFFERIPLDLAQRSIVPETGFISLIFFADKDLVPRLNQAHYVPSNNPNNRTCGANKALCNGSAVAESGPVISGGSPTVIAPGTKMQYQDEFLVGFEYELPHGFVIGARYQDRRIKRIVEDTAAFTVDQALAGGLQQFVIGNVSASTDNFTNVTTITPTNPASQCQPGTFDGTRCFTRVSGQFSGGDGVADGFPDPKREYQAVEITLERRFQKNWQIFSNFRIARLQGNFEGSFRNDNGQQDPNISSLFDFTSAGPTDPLADQFRVGPLPSDRRYTVNFYGSYLFDQGWINGLNLGTGLRVQSGLPISEFNAHPAYENAGELPIGGRGKLGRTPMTGTVDFHADYTWKLTERFRLKVDADVFNLVSARRLTRIDQRAELDATTPNPDFLKPGFPGNVDTIKGFQDPRTSRFALRIAW